MEGIFPIRELERLIIEETTNAQSLLVERVVSFALQWNYERYGRSLKSNLLSRQEERIC